MPRPMISLLCVLCAVLPIYGCKRESNPPGDSHKNSPVYSFRKDGELVVLDKNGTEKARFDIEIAEHEEALQRGLKYRETMADNQGMLFIFDGKQPYGFWMKDTYMPLDMLFIDYEQSIFQIARNSVPFNEEPIEPDGFNKYTLEIKAGMAEKFNIIEGDKVEWKRTDPSSSR